MSGLQVIHKLKRLRRRHFIWKEQSVQRLMIQNDQFTACLKTERSTKTSMKVRVAYQLGRDLQGRPQYIIRTLSQESPKSPLFFQKFFSVALMLLFTCFASCSFLCCDVTFEADFFLTYPSLFWKDPPYGLLGSVCITYQRWDVHTSSPTLCLVARKEK